ncbi:ribosome maturation factor RimP [Collinsella sp. AGMB00827]|uniref:Ribosome maturation factor RimP n=1 Tax=Collinsella ureilytica TaxID=2869515 RepID=A0ABS7MNF5_9ACTN|nr:ribosome maturation factor RimP [Collinsella urealyticum]MBY4797945.1 ribosome maturation factor RimP [Collinsella urealyticum]
MIKTPLETKILTALEDVAADHGIDIVDVEVVGATKAPCVRVRIDTLGEGGITLDEVTQESSWISEAIEALDPVSGSYTLEVSSPGMARPLRRPQDFMARIGQMIQLTTTAREGRKRYQGSIVAADDSGIVLRVTEGTDQRFEFDEIRKCSVKPVFDFKRQQEGN